MAYPLTLDANRSSRRRRAQRVADRRLLLVAVVIAVWAFYLFPLVWLVMMSLKTRADMFAVPPLFVFAPTVEHFRTTLSDEKFLAALRNSLIVTVASVLASLALGS